MFLVIVLIILFNGAIGALPNDLDGFLGVLFETAECESFVADATFLGVSTTKCDPFTCDFPRQLCMRPAEKYQDETANQCRNIPTECLTVANGGIPLGPVNPQSSKMVVPAIRINGNGPPPVKILTGTPDVITSPIKRHQFGDICTQTVPEGRFCGFALKFTFNKETGNCEQFWFPGCRIDLTNDNLFDSEDKCRIATKHCGETGPIETPKPMRIRVPTPIPTTLPPTTTTTKKPTTTTPEPEYPDPDFGPLAPAPPSGPKLPGGVDFGSLAKTFMGGGSGGGIVGQFLGSGLGGGNSGPPPTSSVVPDGYGGASLGGAGIGGGNPGGNGGGNGNFISLIANTVKELNNKPPGGQPGASAAAQVAQQWLNPQQIGQFGSLFSSFGR